MKLILIILISAISIYSSAQNTNTPDPVERIYRSKNTTEDFYIAFIPATKPKGLLVILPGFGGPPEKVLNETTLVEQAKKDGFAVIIPYLAIDTDCTDSLSQSRLYTLIPEVIKKYNVPQNKFIIGGHSIGGNGALLYAENANRLNNEKIIKPNLVFAVDPPLDMKRLWESFTYFKKINFSTAAVSESDFFLKRFEQRLGGSPKVKPDAYRKISSFSRDVEDGGNAKYLKSTPVRLYCDPDVNWYIENRRTPVEHTNLADLSACIVQLKLLGNDKAELITNLGKGYFPDGRRHPHGFSQLDADEFLKWANQMLDNK